MQNRPFCFIIALWGKKYRDYFYSLCVPTLLAPNNVPILRDRPGCKIIIATTVEDWNDLKNRPLIKRLGEYIEFFHIDIGLPGDTPPLLHAAKGHRLGCRKAYEDRAFAGWLTPDLLLSDGLIAKAVSLIDSGKKVVLCPALRFAMEHPLERLKGAGFLRPNEPMAIPAQFLSAIAVNSLHPELLRYDFDCEEFDNYPIWTFWRVPGRNGLVLYTVSWALVFADFAEIPNYQDQSFEYSTNDGFFAHENFGHLRKTEHVAFLNDLYDGVFMSLTPSNEMVFDSTNARLSNRYHAQYGLGTLKRLKDIHRFHHGPEIDPFRRWFHTVPIIIHADPVDLRYRRTILTTRSIMKHATRDRFLWDWLLGLPSGLQSHQHTLPEKVSFADLLANVGGLLLAQAKTAAGLITARARRLLEYLKIPFILSADILAGRKTIRHVAKRLMDEIGIRRWTKR